MVQEKTTPEDLQHRYARAVSLHEQGELARAIALYEELVREVPDGDLIHYNLGLAYYDHQQYGRAGSCFSRAAAINDQEADYWYNLGLSRKQEERYPEAVSAYGRALRLRPDDRETLYNLGCCCKDCGALDHAVEVYEHLLELDPGYIPALNNLAYIVHLQGDLRRAESLYQAILESAPEHINAGYMAAALGGEQPAAPPQAYVRDLFDSYSQDFEGNLVEDLAYQVPERLWQLFNQGPRRERYDYLLDLGCGTGLCGVHFRPCCHYLEGVDLSGRMIARAREKGLYDSLVEGELLSHLQRTTPGFDLVIAGDVCIYLGDLAPLMATIAARGSREVQFCFSVEAFQVKGQGKGQGWELRPSGRYGHSYDYILDLARQSGLSLCGFEQTWLRQERGKAIDGFLFFLGRA
ncbi:tetratricopeptide repeat protein [Desulfogranum mediterraneum]|uniref:tetratricopeptide repeat protein n=1 Tax=Desulfogranum mediterraneum TaxID=160661 RepID=UPI0004125C25|nr:tetratricopeptide repeat protein [Desulfogranum mediterraneum]